MLLLVGRLLLLQLLLVGVMLLVGIVVRCCWIRNACNVPSCLPGVLSFWPTA
jgi:hypothetical protein